MIKNLYLIVLLFSIFSAAGNSQICFTITDDGNGGIDICGSGSAIVSLESNPAFVQVGVSDFGFSIPNETFADFGPAFETTINGQPWSFSTVNFSSQVDPSSTLMFNNSLLNSFGNGTINPNVAFFSLGLNTAGAAVSLPDSDGVTPLSASGCANFSFASIDDMPGSTLPGQTTVIDLFGKGEILFKITAPEIVPTLGQWGMISLGMLLLIFGVQTIKQREFILG